MLHFSETEINENEPILFIHGIGAGRWMWWQQEKAFSDYPIILVDLPGHGKSVSVPWISLMDTTDMIAKEVIKNRTVHVVGISLGGHVALELAKRHPDKILSAFISGITATPMRFQFLLKMQSRIVQREIQNERYLNRVARDYYHLPPDKAAEFRANYQLLTRKTYETIWKEIMQFQLDQSYGNIAVPCLFTAGDQESPGILEAVSLAPELVPNSVGRLIPGAQHAWPVQKAHEFNQLLRDWLNCLPHEKHGE
ncbi:alpha/beta hydrolase [Microbacterium sp. APC 3898]|uniref:Alpha/beta hydrolase n=1 Tax=Planococcus notacanthi TaxID=3035188 RepID=A0ABT7ZGP8_9BACL|nr:MULTISPECIES: alpha/beta hydrolase [Terrabacteria group]MDN3426330.1 alpha/beta hydrolase [Planococcus sp. APC 4016]MDN3498026.1 alpha/beta hydrolase [Microbacterium sp. APC 3898]